MATANTFTWSRPVERALLTALAAPFGARTGMPSVTTGRTPVLMTSVALTFDDGPDHHTPYFLEVLERYEIKATFFIVGEQVEDSPDMLRRVVAAGHEVGVHCYRHLPYPRRHDVDAADDLRRALALIEDAGGVRPALFRPPYGLFSRSVSRCADRESLEKVLWSRAGFDWGSRATPESVAANVGVPEPGDIVLLHDSERYGAPGSHRSTLEALPVIIESLRDKHLGFDTASELLRFGRDDEALSDEGLSDEGLSEVEGSLG